ncbi:methanobactin biosynthesis cassette protein MbnC [Methylocystis sp. MJC1]|uniref:methanobactin biosynthesis protein MbnC n=1 Tax=Methylocystis sp. MJC1 TaxID=2654282 RepID=UPI0013EBAAD7|nr:methanobactin biosynthesis protein MbnC [Methylocystis sp. MJC1]KAF2988752.1 hypothetical protein MJC1_04170 [Methylocystis sp. MJC1]MBU6526829.1 methanobactin biosynthesis cassette protein MbnC [Methylocystis sp. MJC1]UZX13264.1 methanobactin biosynthesis cassette protein MbnC [Methylocystis sp. MJC1]
MTCLSPAPARLDADLLDDFANPERQSAYPRESRAYVRVDISIRAYWHALFDQVPELLELSGPDGRAIFLPFMEWARAKGVTFNWAFYLWVYGWLMQSGFRDRLGRDLLLRMMSAAAGRWIGVDRDTDRCALVIGSPMLEGAVVVGWKLKSLQTTVIPVERLDLEEPLSSPAGHFGCFYAPSFDLDYFPGWKSIPL